MLRGALGQQLWTITCESCCRLSAHRRRQRRLCSSAARPDNPFRKPEQGSPVPGSPHPVPLDSPFFRQVQRSEL
jgi:hypothetical protein